MTDFYVRRIMDNSNTNHIGWQVMSKSKTGGERRHFSRMANHPVALECARNECETEATRLTIESLANRAR